MHLEEKLRAEWPAILRWCIDGAVSWYREGLNPPDRVLEASRDYLDGEDLLAEFLEDELRRSDHPAASIAIREVYQVFRRWSEARGMRSPWSQHALTRGLSQRNEPIARRNDGRHLVGYRLRLPPIGGRTEWQK